MRHVGEDGKGRAHWEWLRTANPWLPPYDRLIDGQIDMSTYEMSIKVALERPTMLFQWDPWLDALNEHPIKGVASWTWDQKIRTVLYKMASALCPESPEHYKSKLVEAARRVRAMAPEDMQWGEPWDFKPYRGSHSERRILHAAIRCITSADSYHEQGDDRSTEMLKVAEAYLHGLWLEAGRKA